MPGFLLQFPTPSFYARLGSNDLSYLVKVSPRNIPEESSPFVFTSSKLLQLFESKAYELAIVCCLLLSSFVSCGISQGRKRDPQFPKILSYAFSYNLCKNIIDSIC